MSVTTTLMMPLAGSPAARLVTLRIMRLRVHQGSRRTRRVGRRGQMAGGKGRGWASVYIRGW